MKPSKLRAAPWLALILVLASVVAVPGAILEKGSQLINLVNPLVNNGQFLFTELYVRNTNGDAVPFTGTDQVLVITRIYWNFTASDSSMNQSIQLNLGNYFRQGGKLVRGAGGSARVMAKEGDWVTVVLPSGEMRVVRKECRATIGRLGNPEWQNVRIGKAGRMRHMGIRPHVRGKAQNPVDHPLGGGEGRSNGGRHPCSPSGVLAKGGKTRSPRKISNARIIRRRKNRQGQTVL